MFDRKILSWCFDTKTDPILGKAHSNILRIRFPATLYLIWFLR